MQPRLALMAAFAFGAILLGAYLMGAFAQPLMPHASLKAAELAPRSGTVKRVVILLHGSDGSSADMMTLAPTFQDALPDTLFLAPNGPFPSQKSSYQHQWLSQASLVGAQQGALALNRYIEEVKTHFGIGDEQVALVGYSAGSMIGLYAGLRRNAPLGAIVGFSAGMGSDQAPASNRTPVCLIYGDRDERYASIVHTIRSLRTAGTLVEAHVRPGLGHDLDAEGVHLATQFLHKAFKL